MQQKYKENENAMMKITAQNKVVGIKQRGRMKSGGH